ncbi:Hypothetical predicted protein [Pelobates cultripes]|uniref:Uncharacterized protein n=1 Tax=Pelobates cultripes TaxID=61616 RepID=A0AAD1WW10_PELCU|nr:Hypothetical predicted protein [Pelobates cultripes]
MSNLKTDSGVKCNAMSSSTLQCRDPNAQIDQSNKVNLITYSSQTIQTLVTAILALSKGKLLFQIVDRNVRILLGLPYSIWLNLIQLSPEIHAVQLQAPEITDYENLFRTDPIGKSRITCSWMNQCIPLCVPPEGSHWL